jgi:hypothetical protein
MKPDKAACRRPPQEKHVKHVSKIPRALFGPSSREGWWSLVGRVGRRMCLADEKRRYSWLVQSERLVDATSDQAVAADLIFIDTTLDVTHINRDWEVDGHQLYRRAKNMPTRKYNIIFSHPCFSAHSP